MACNGMVGLSAGCRVTGADCFWLRPVRPGRHLPPPDNADAELECTLNAPATSGAPGGHHAAGRRLTFC